MNVVSRLPTDAQLSSTTIEVLRGHRRRRFCCREDLLQAFAEANDAYEQAFGYRFTVRGCWMSQYFHLDAENAGLSLYGDCRDDDIPTEVALDLIHAALYTMEQCVSEGDDDVFTAHSAFMFVHDEKMNAWTGENCAVRGC